MIGEPRDALATPALILDRPVVERNVAEMARRMEGLPAALRPHVKIHKSPILAQLQLDAGAIGLTTATIWEASAMVDAGLSDVLVANQVVGPLKAAEAARIAGLGRVIVTVESAANAAELSAAARKAGTEIGVLVELDVGLHRSGVRSVEAAVELARRIETLPGLRLDGLLGYEGHCMLEPDRKVRVEKAKASNEILVAAADAFDEAGLPTRIVAAGGPARGTSRAQTRGSPRSTPARTSSWTRSTATSCPGSRSG
ncbi:MAG TPA: alanine racemase [Gaiellaceae bacterium]|nr:alanine racemase [Gaiellaceae bacterium]